MVLNPTTGVAVAAVPVEEEGVGGKLEIAEEEGAIDDVGPPGVRGSLGGREAAIAGFSRGGSDDGGGDGFSPKPGFERGFSGASGGGCRGRSLEGS